mmetsp:Transcript_338/g.815  ORF Transcript_338/g.815 Transcript_338/m.815 type:complete len:160 (-) Transcript_338:2861-3340(-)
MYAIGASDAVNAGGCAELEGICDVDDAYAVAVGRYALDAFNEGICVTFDDVAYGIGVDPGIGVGVAFTYTVGIVGAIDADVIVDSTYAIGTSDAFDTRLCVKLDDAFIGRDVDVTYDVIDAGDRVGSDDRFAPTARGSSTPQQYFFTSERNRLSLRMGR